MYTVAQLRNLMTNRVRLSSGAADIANMQDQAIGQMIDACWWRIQDVTWADLPVDGITQRWFLPGEDITIMTATDQTRPNGLGTARRAAPTAAPTATASGAGSTLLAGTYRVAVAYNTAYGQSGLSPIGAVTIAAGQNIAIAAITPVAATTGVPTLVSIQCYLSAPNDYIWTDAGTVAAGAIKTITAPGAAPASGQPFIGYLAFNGVAWNAIATDQLLIEDGVKADGTVVNPSVDPWGGTISASTAPIVVGTGTLVRVNYQRRVPQPDYTVGASVVRVYDRQFARIATVGYYLGILADNQPGGDVRSWRAESDSMLTAAAQLYREAVPTVLPARMRVDAWLSG